MKQFLFGIVLGSVTLFPVQAKEVAGVDLADQIELAGQSLLLNGAGVRSKFFFKIYVGGLYLKQSSSDVAEILTMDGARRVHMHFLYDEVPAKKLAAAWQEGFEENQPPERLQQLGERLARFNALFGDAKRGDVVLLDYLPGEGTRVTIRGEVAGTIPGRDLSDALLQVWLGDKPADGGLKQGMLGRD